MGTGGAGIILGCEFDDDRGWTVRRVCVIEREEAGCTSMVRLQLLLLIDPFRALPSVDSLPFFLQETLGVLFQWRVSQAVRY